MFDVEIPSHHHQHSQRKERWFVWHVIFFEEANPGAAVSKYRDVTQQRGMFAIEVTVTSEHKQKELTPFVSGGNGLY